MRRTEPSDLPGVVKEIVDALRSGDWTRYADSSGERFYYIIRESNHAEDDGFFDDMTLGEIEQSVYWDWFIRAALAEDSENRLKAARKRVADAGADPHLFDTVIDACRRARTVEELAAIMKEAIPRFMDADTLDGLVAVAEAVLVERVRGGHVTVSEPPEFRKALEGFFLRELAQRYPKVVKRASEFDDWLPFSDPQLREALRCYLYGFFPAAIVVAGVALETRLKAIANVRWIETYEELVDGVFGVGGVYAQDETLASALKDLFRHRNDVVHKGVRPPAERHSTPSWSRGELSRRWPSNSESARVGPPSSTPRTSSVRLS